MKMAFKWVNILMISNFVLLVPIMLLFTNVQLVAFNREYYESQYKNYNISESMNISMDELMYGTNNLLLYIEDKRNNLDFEVEFAEGKREYFSERDKQHMIDVKGLFMKGRRLRNFALIYIVAFIFYLFKSSKSWKKKIAKYNIAAFIAGTLPILLLIALMNIDFNKYFTIFHEMFFNNDLWLLDPNNDTLINMFPESFFADTAFKIGYYYIIELAVILTASIIYLIAERNKTKDKVGGLL